MKILIKEDARDNCEEFNWDPMMDDMPGQVFDIPEVSGGFRSGGYDETDNSYGVEHAGVAFWFSAHQVEVINE